MRAEPRTTTITSPNDAARYAIRSDALTVYVRVGSDGRFEVQDLEHSVVPIRTADYAIAVSHAHALWEAMHADTRRARAQRATRR